MSDLVKFRPPPPPSRDTTSFVGMAIFLGAWAMTFAGLFFAYFDVRIAAKTWPEPGVALKPPVPQPQLT